MSCSSCFNNLCNCVATAERDLEDAEATISSLRSQVAALTAALGKVEEALENIPPHIRERLADPAYTAALEYIAEHLQGAMDSAMATDGWSSGYPHRAEKTFRHAYWKFKATRQAATGPEGRIRPEGPHSAGDAGLGEGE